MSTVEAKHARPAARIVRLLGDVDFADQGTFCARLDAAVSLGAPIIVDMDRFRVISSIRPRCRHGTVVPDS